MEHNNRYIQENSEHINESIRGNSQNLNNTPQFFGQEDWTIFQNETLFCSNQSAIPTYQPGQWNDQFEDDFFMDELNLERESENLLMDVKGIDNALDNAQNKLNNKILDPSEILRERFPGAEQIILRKLMEFESIFIRHRDLKTNVLLNLDSVIGEERLVELIFNAMAGQDYKETNGGMNRIQETIPRELINHIEYQKAACLQQFGRGNYDEDDIGRGYSNKRIDKDESLDINSVSNGYESEKYKWIYDRFEKYADEEDLKVLLRYESIIVKFKDYDIPYWPNVFEEELSEFDILMQAVINCIDSLPREMKAGIEEHYHETSISNISKMYQTFQENQSINPRNQRREEVMEEKIAKNNQSILSENEHSYRAPSDFRRFSEKNDITEYSLSINSTDSIKIEEHWMVKKFKNSGVDQGLIEKLLHFEGRLESFRFDKIEDWIDSTEIDLSGGLDIILTQIERQIRREVVKNGGNIGTQVEGFSRIPNLSTIIEETQLSSQISKSSSSQSANHDQIEKKSNENSSNLLPNQLLNINKEAPVSLIKKAAPTTVKGLETGEASCRNENNKESLIDENKRLLIVNEGLKGKCNNLEKQLSETQNKVTNISAELKTSEEIQNQQKRSLNEKEIEIKKLKEELKKKESELEKAAEQLSKTKAEVQLLTSQQATLNSNPFETEDNTPNTADQKTPFDDDNSENTENTSNPFS